MSADARPQTPDDDDNESAWRPSKSPDQSPGDTVFGIREGFEKVVERGSEAAGSALLLVILLLLLNALGDDDDDDSAPMTPQERSAEWNTRAEPIQERFEENNVDEDDVEDGIAWARSE